MGARADLVLNVVLFQAGWFACVLGAAHGHAVAGTGIAALIVAIHALRATRPAEEIKLIACAMVIGAVLDSIVVAAGVLDYRGGSALAPVAPPWIVALWALFATTLNVSLSWLKSRLLVASILGAVAGPLSYAAGAKLGALTFTHPTAAMLALALEWAIAMPLLALLARRYDGVATPGSSPIAPPMPLATGPKV